MAVNIKSFYTGGSSTDDIGGLKSYIEIDGSIDFNGLTQAVKDFVEANKHKFFFGGVQFDFDFEVFKWAFSFQ